MQSFLIMICAWCACLVIAGFAILRRRKAGVWDRAGVTAMSVSAGACLVMVAGQLLALITS